MILCHTKIEEQFIIFQYNRENLSQDKHSEPG